MFKYIMMILFSVYSSFVLSYVCDIKNPGFIVCISLLFCYFLNFFMETKKLNKQKKWYLILNRCFKSIILFMIGGATYNVIELAFRNYTHWSMFILGGLCFILIGVLNELFNLSITSQMLISAVVITSLEFVTGYIVNIIFELNIWDYSNLPYNFMGQICLLFFNLWFLLSFVAIIIDDYIRSILYDETMPKYYL